CGRPLVFPTARTRSPEAVAARSELSQSRSSRPTTTTRPQRIGPPRLQYAQQMLLPLSHDLRGSPNGSGASLRFVSSLLVPPCSALLLRGNAGQHDCFGPWLSTAALGRQAGRR